MPLDVTDWQTLKGKLKGKMWESEDALVLYLINNYIDFHIVISTFTTIYKFIGSNDRIHHDIYYLS
jgi:hypothetical protein